MKAFRKSQRDSMSRPSLQKAYFREGYEIKLPRVSGESFGKLFDGGHKGMIATFPTRSAALKFIKSGDLAYYIEQAKEDLLPPCHSADPELFSFFSDYYKDTNGIRPSGDYWTVNRVKGWIENQKKCDEEDRAREEIADFELI